MTSLDGLVAYPSTPDTIGATIQASLEILQKQHGFRGLSSWEEHDIAGRFVVEPVLEKIDKGNCLVADITRLNFNVVYEIGYAIGCKKRVVLVANSTLISDAELCRDVGIFDTLGYKKYQNSLQLVELIRNVVDLAPIRFDDKTINLKTPVYVVMPRQKSDVEIRIVARLKKGGIHSIRKFDPEEQGRLPADQAIDNVACSHGVIVPLLTNNHIEARIHNFRGAFVGGLAEGMGKRLLLLQYGEDPVPLDYRDLVSTYRFIEQIDAHIAKFCPDITARFQSETQPMVVSPTTFLAQINLGSSFAENEFRDLGNYYLQTDEYQRALRGEVQIVAGRKGSGKTALFAQIRDKLQVRRSVVVLDLMPEGFQLVKFKESVLDLLEAGTKEHTITAFWEYLLLLEACHKILTQDQTLHLHDHRLFASYQSLAATYMGDEYVSECDFSERMLKLINRIGEECHVAVNGGQPKKRLNTAEVTELLYKHDVADLRQRVHDYLMNKDSLWVLFDNLDKGWSTRGLGPGDLIMIRCLLDAISKLQRSLRKANIDCYGVIFIRNDVYELLLEHTPDRGKVARVILDWTDPEILREVLRRRFVVGLDGNLSFTQIWGQIAVSHVNGEESSQYIIDRCLMRPRCLIDIIQHCRSHAVNLGHAKIELEDILEGEGAYSTDFVANINYEIRDICPDAGDLVYEFIGYSQVIDANQLDGLLDKVGVAKDKRDEIVDILLWYGFLGFLREGGDPAYVYSVKYDMKRLRALIEKQASDGSNLVYCINPAFWKGLEIV